MTKLLTAIIFLIAVAATNMQTEEIELVANKVIVEEVEQTSSSPPYYDISLLERIPELELTEEDMKLIAMVAFNEAGNQSELGKRLVIDTILNRLEHSAFPDSISKVIHQPNQFSDHTSKLHDDILDLVEDECMKRTNEDVIFFQRYNYSSFGEPLLVEGAHFFNSLEDKEVNDE